MYHTVKRLGIPDSQIIMMLSDATHETHSLAWCTTTPTDLICMATTSRWITGHNGELLTDRVASRSKRLLTDDRSNIFIYITGHGGDEFLKFQDAEKISAFDLADSFKIF